MLINSVPGGQVLVVILFFQLFCSVDIVNYIVSILYTFQVGGDAY